MSWILFTYTSELKLFILNKLGKQKIHVYSLSIGLESLFDVNCIYLNFRLRYNECSYNLFKINFIGKLFVLVCILKFLLETANRKDSTCWLVKKKFNSMIFGNKQLLYLIMIFSYNN